MVLRAKIVFLLATLCVLIVAVGGLSACGSPAGRASETSVTSVAESSTTLSIPVGNAGGTPLPQPISPQSVKTKYLDLPYVDTSPSRRLDIYLPEGLDGPFPVIVQIHGGAVSVGEKRDRQLNPVLSALSRGYAVAAVNYRLSWEAKFPAAIYDVKAAVRYIRANALKYHLDPARIAAWGDSAGGYLAAMLGVTADVAALEDKGQGNGEVSSRVGAVVDWFGPIDFGQIQPQLNAAAASPVATDSAANSWESRFLGSPVGRSSRLVREANPTTYITADDPPFLIEQGTADKTVPVQQSKDFATALGKVVGTDRVTLVLLDGAGHDDPRFSSAQNLGLVLDWLDAHLK